jgi:hypothetical protein
MNGTPITVLRPEGTKRAKKRPSAPRLTAPCGAAEVEGTELI